MFCRYCGAELIEGASFCGKCGKQIVLDELNESVAPSEPIITPDVDHGATLDKAATAEPFEGGETIRFDEQPVAEPSLGDPDVQNYQQQSEAFTSASQSPNNDQMRIQYEEQMRLQAQAEMEARIRMEAEAKIRAEYEQKRRQEKADAARTKMKNATGGMLSQLKHYGRFCPEKGFTEITKGQGFMWAILLGINWFIFSFGIAVFEREIVVKIFGGVRGISPYLSSYAAQMRNVIGTFGGWLGSAALVWLIACGIVAGLSFLYVSVIKHSGASFVQVLNMIGYITIPVSAVMLLNMILGLISPVIPLLTFGYTVIYFWILLYHGLASFIEKEERSAMPLFIILIITVLISLLIFIVLAQAVIQAGTGGYGLGGFDLSDLF